MHYFVPQRCQQSRKIMYKTKTQALTAAEQCGIEQGVELTVYRCDYCGTWHLTHHLEDGPRWFGASSSGFFGQEGKRRASRRRAYKPRRR